VLFAVVTVTLPLLPGVKLNQTLFEFALGPS